MECDKTDDEMEAAISISLLANYGRIRNIRKKYKCISLKIEQSTDSNEIHELNMQILDMTDEMLKVKKIHDQLSSYKAKENPENSK